MNPTTLEQARAAKARASEAFGKHGHCSVGIAEIDGGYGVKVNFTTAPEKLSELPAEIDGVPVRVEVTGPVKKREL